MLTCPNPIQAPSKVLLEHGSGGKLSQRLFETVFAPAFDNPMLGARHDGARFDIAQGALAFSTDSFVVKPIFFPGGDIGSLAIHGTVNDLAMCGARPLYLSCGFIIEEGFAMADLQRVVTSMKTAAHKAGIDIVTGDTKVVEKGKGDGLYINTSGIGQIISPMPILPSSIQTGDEILINGDIGRHGMAILSVRDGLEFESPIISDSDELASTVLALFAAGIEVHCLRDLTRGGLATAVVEVADTAQRNVELEEGGIRVDENVRGGCEILGLDPLYIANEGRFIAIVPPAHADHALDVMKRVRPENEPMRIGRVGGSITSGDTGGNPSGDTNNASDTGGRSRARVTLRNSYGVKRIIEALRGEQLPRIC